MNQIISWVCLISVSLLCLQVMVYICEETLKVFNEVAVSNRTRKRKIVSTKYSYDYKTKIAK